MPFLRWERSGYRLAEMLLASTLGGVSYGKVMSWVLHFCRCWPRSEPHFVHAFWQRFHASMTFLKAGRQSWSYRLNTTNLGEGFFRDLRRFLGRFAGFVSPGHCDRALGLYQLGAEIN